MLKYISAEKGITAAVMRRIFRVTKSKYQSVGVLGDSFMLACEQEFCHVLIPQDIVFVEPELAVFHVGLIGIDLRKKGINMTGKEKFLPGFHGFQNINNRSTKLFPVIDIDY